MPQDLSPQALRRKRIRDLKYANSRDREIKRADSQKRRRAALKNGANLDGKDFDHNTGRFTSVSHNRGGTQPQHRKDGTKAES
jgi:hypothetical protein|tara:strand:- start:1431 stop:1679 length:249 start_codon:yes stop_codon:yes gene_type:complete